MGAVIGGGGEGRPEEAVLKGKGKDEGGQVTKEQWDPACQDRSRGSGPIPPRHPCLPVLGAHS